MNLKEKVVLSAYTGVLMCDFEDVHKYIEGILNRPVWIHELADSKIWDEIKEKARYDFMDIIKGE